MRRRWPAAHQLVCPCCRGEGSGGFFDLPGDQQERLRPLLDDRFVAEHADRFTTTTANAER